MCAKVFVFYYRITFLFNIKQQRSPQKAPAKDTSDPWAKFQDDWGDDPNDPQRRRNPNGEKPAYKEKGKKGIFNVKSAGPKRDKMMGETGYKLDNPTKGEGDREYLWDDGRGAGGFGMGVCLS